MMLWSQINMWFAKTKVVVHDGTFHADDVFAVAVLRRVFGKSKIKIIRTRNKDIIDKADIVADVGLVYDSTKNLFDHHQQGGAGKRENGIPYASFGLVWKHFGKKLVNDDVFMIMDKDYVAPIDASDNGYGMENNSDIQSIDADTLIKLFNPTWREEEKNYDIGFEKAVNIADQIFDRMLNRAESKSAGKKIADEAYLKAEDKRVIVLDLPLSSDHFLDKKDVQYIIFPSNGKWHIKAMPVKEKTFDLRKPFPVNWAGKNDTDLAQVSGVEDAVFCHNARFLCVTTSKIGAIKLANTAINT